MSVINISDKTKEEFTKLKLKYSMKIGKNLTENDFMHMLLNKLSERKK